MYAFNVFGRRRFTSGRRRLSSDCRRHSLGQSGPNLLATLLLAFNLQAPVVLASPDQVVVTHGELQLTTTAGGLDIDQTSQNAIAHWQSFSIGANEVVNINQLNESAALLNRVTGADPSQLLGQLNSNGRVFLINPNGVLVGENAQINAGEFIAATLDISDADFLSGGDLNFSGDSTAGIVNLGSITSASGDLVLIASTVTNAGLLSASEGQVALGAGNEVLLTHQGNQRLIVKSDLTKIIGNTGIDNTGVIEAAEAALVAAGGDIYDLAINQTGLVKATGVENRDGRILLTAENGNILFSGTAEARNADGSGGSVKIGGGLRGADETITHAALTRVTATALIDVSSQFGDAGDVVIWADERTDFDGVVNATTTADQADGGFVEVSGKQQLNFDGFVDLRAQSGDHGTLLLDPDSITVQNTNAGGDPNVVLVSTLETQLGSGNVTLDASSPSGIPGDPDGSITINDAVSWVAATDLKLDAGNNISINANLNAPAGNIDLSVGYVDFSGTTADLFVDAGATIRANSLKLGGGTANLFSNSPDGNIGSILVEGVVNVSMLDISLPVATFDDGGVDGDVTIANAANQIGSITNTGAGNRIGGSLTIVDSTGDLSISGDFNVSGGDVSISTAGNLTLAAGASIATSDDDDNLFLAAAGGSFVNDAGPTALSTAETGRFLIYSDDPANTTLGGLIAKPVYNKTFGANAPGTVTQPGDRVLYSLAPTLTLTANNLSRLENEANPALSYSVSGLVGDDAPSAVFGGTPALSTTALMASPLGSYPITIANGTLVLSDYNYSLSLVPGTLTVGLNPSRLLTVTADDMSRVYGEADPAFTATISGFRTGDDATVVSGLQFTTTATLQSPVGTYTITPFGASATNYTFSYVPGTLTIDLRDLTITADSLDKVFGTEPALPGFTISGLASFDSASDIGTIVTASAGVARLANVGAYSVVPGGVTSPNYNVTYVNGLINVTRAPLTITTNNSSRAFNTPNPAFSISTAGLVSGDSLDTTGLMFTTSATQASDVGLYSVAAGGVMDPNYDITYVAGSLEILAAQLTITADSFTRDYGSANPVFTYTSAGLLAGDDLEDVVSNIVIGSPATQGSSAGRYAITVSGTRINDNYSVAFNPGTLTIEKVDLDLFLALGSRLYGDPNPTPQIVAIGLVNGDTTAVVNSVSTQTLASESSGVGSYPVLFQSANATNYNIRSINNGTLNVLPRPLTITADSYTREYGEPNPDLTASFDGLASVDTESAITGLSITTPATPSSNVLDYGISVSSNANPNYDITYQQGRLSVTPAPLTIEVGDISRLYGQNIPDLVPNVDFFSQLKLDDLPSSLGFQLVTDADLRSDVGQYAITAEITNSNYLLDVRRSGTLTIEPAPLTISLSDFGRVYGERDALDYSDFSALGLRTTGLMLADRASDVVSVSNPTDVTTGVGVYGLEIDLTSANYELAGFSGGFYTIMPRAIAIKPDNIVRFYGDPDPALGYVVGGDGLASFDSIDDVVFVNDPLINGSFGERAPAGARTMLAQLTGNPNYIVANRQGYYVVLPRPVEITVADAEAFGGRPLPDFLATATNLAPFDDVDLAFPELTFRVLRDDDPAPVQSVMSIEDFVIPEVFRNDVFLARYPSTIQAPSGSIDPESDREVSQITPIEIDFIGEPESDGIIVRSTLTISSSLFTQAEQESDEPVIQYVQAIASNPNYVIVGNTNGQLEWFPDPELTAQRRELENELSVFNEAYDAFWNSDDVYGNKNGALVVTSTPSSNNNLLNLPDGAEQTVMEAIGARLLAEAANGEKRLARLLENYGNTARGTVSFSQLTGGAYSNFDTLAFLQAARTDPGAAELLAEIYADYVIDLVGRDPASFSDAQSLVIERLNETARDARDEMADTMEAKYNEWMESPETQARFSSLSSTFGVDIPYAEFMGEAAGDYIEATTAGYITGAVAGGAAATAAVTAVIGATGAIFPYAMSASAVAASTTGASALSIAGGTATTVSTAAIAGPAVIIGVAVAGSIARGVQVFKTAAQKKDFDTWLADRGEPFDVTSLELENKKGEPNPVDNAIMLSAITAMMAGR